MIRKPNFKLNWKYALGELVLIFMGISLAIWFDNWNDNRKKDNLEKEVLEQLHTDINASMNDIRSDIDLLNIELESHLKIMRMMNTDQPYDSMLAFDFEWLRRDEQTYPITVSYERLKSLGLELIKDDSLRIQLALLYDFHYPRISKSEAYYPNIQDFYAEFYQEHFRPNTDPNLKYTYVVNGDTVTYPVNSGQYGLFTIGYVPENFEALKRNARFEVMIRQSLDFRTYKINRYNRIRAVSEIILSLISQELDGQVSDDWSD